MVPVKLVWGAIQVIPSLIIKTKINTKFINKFNINKRKRYCKQLENTAEYLVLGWEMAF